MTSKRTVLITGCSDGSLGAALALEFKNRGLHVYATGRNLSKLKQVKEAGCEVLALDVLSASSIAECVAKIPHLDILVNNAGGGYSMPISDIDISEAKKLFDLNMWAPIAVTQAFLPLLRSSKGLVANHTSVGSVIGLPFQSTYNASKAAMAMYSDTMRLEFGAFNVKVVEIKSGGVKSNFLGSQAETHGAIPPGSLYESVKEKAEEVLSGKWVEQGRQGPADVWAREVVGDLLKKNPPYVLWRGPGAGTVRLATLLPTGTLDGKAKSLTGVDVIEKQLRK